MPPALIIIGVLYFQKKIHTHDFQFICCLLSSSFRSHTRYDIKIRDQAVRNKQPTKTIRPPITLFLPTALFRLIYRDFIYFIAENLFIHFHRIFISVIFKYLMIRYNQLFIRILYSGSSMGNEYDSFDALLKSVHDL